MAKKSHLPKNPLVNVPPVISAEEELRLRLELLNQKFMSDRSHTLPAFETLAAVVGHAWQHDENTKNISVPFWAAELLVEGHYHVVARKTKRACGRIFSGGCNRRQPSIHRRRTEGAVRSGGGQVALDVEGVVDGGVSGEESLG